MGNDFIRKPDILIRAIYSASNTMREQTLTINYSLSCLSKKENQFYACMRGRELANVFGIKNATNLSRTLKRVATDIKKSIVIIDGEFEPVVSDAEYQDGLFTLIYNEKMTPYFEFEGV